MELLAVENLSFTYPLCCDAAVRNISFSVNKGDFIVVCGATGSGKSTLLRLLKRELAPLGTQSGSIFFRGKELCESCAIGFVMQQPEQQLVTDKVWHELAFGLESMGLERGAIRRRVAEMSSYFGIESWFDKNVSELSGGQKQILNLASVMAMQPELLILDEPTAQLDPVAAEEFISILKRLNRELMVTILLAEHRLEEVTAACDRLLVLENGERLAYDVPRKAMSALAESERLASAMPVAARLHYAVGAQGECPLTIRQGRAMLEKCFPNNIKQLPAREYTHEKTPALSFTDVFFRYSRELPDVLRGLSFTAYENELFCVLGSNGSGKSTALGAAAGLNRIYSGKIRVFGKTVKNCGDGCLALLPQDVQTLFLRNTVREELEEAGASELSLPYDLTPLYDKHPYDLSGGEQQLVALAIVLATKPRVLLLDEPTKGLDAYAKRGIMRILRELCASGVTVVAVTHDVEFAACCADRCALFFRGEIVSEAEPREFFSGNSIYTTAVSRMTRGYYSRAVTLEDAAELCKLNGRREGA